MSARESAEMNQSVESNEKHQRQKQQWPTKKTRHDTKQKQN